MKILIYAHQFPPAKGGVAYSNLEIAMGLSSLGHNIHVIACHNKGMKQFVSNLPFPVKIIPKWPFTTVVSLNRKGVLNWFFFPCYYYLIHKEMKIFDPDVCLIADTNANCFWGAIGSHFKTPYVSYWSVPTLMREQMNYGCSFKGKLKHLVWGKMRGWMWSSYKRASKILVVGNSTKECLIREEPEVNEKVDVIPRSINNVFFYTPVKKYKITNIQKKIGINQSDFVLLSISRLIINKGIGDVIKSLKAIENDLLQNIKYIVIGEGEDAQYFKEVTNKLHLQNVVIFLGELDHLELIHYYDLCDVFILPTRRGVKESFGRVFVEAAARNKASIAAMDGGVPDVIDDNKTGFLVQVGDVDAICEKIKYAASNRMVLKAMGNDARRKAEKLYTSITVATAFEKYLKNAIMEKIC